MKYTRSPNFNVGMKTRRTRRSRFGSVSRKVTVSIASNGGDGPFIWTGANKNLKQWQRTSERHRRAAFKSVVDTIALFNGRLEKIDVYPAKGKYARESIYATKDLSVDTILAVRDAQPGRVYQSVMGCTATFPKKEYACAFEKRCKSMLEKL